MIDAFKIGIVLNISSNASRVLGVMSADFAKTEKSALALETAMKRINRSVLLLGASGAMAFGLDKALKPAMEYQHQLSLMQNNLNNQVQSAKAVAAAWQTAKDVLTSTPTENLKVLGETKFAFGSLDEAIKNLPQFMKMNAVLASVVGKEGADQAFSAAKLQEIRGSVGNSEEFMRQVDAMVRTAQATQGRVGPDGFLQFGKMAAPFTNKFNDQFLYNEAPTLMQDMGPSRAGTAINTLLQAVIGGRMTMASFATAQSLGLIDKDAKYKIGSAGTIQLEKRQFHGSDLAEKDPLEWVRQYLVPAIGGRSGNDVLLLLTQLFNNRNAQRPAMDFIQNDWRYIKDMAQTLQPRGIASYDDMLKTDTNTAMAAAGAQWDKLWTVFGLKVVPRLIPLIDKLAEALSKLADISAKHPGLPTFVLEAAGIITAIVGIAGAFNLLAAPLGLIVATMKGAGLLATGTAGTAALSGGAALAAGAGVAVVAAGVAGAGKELYDHRQFGLNALSGGGLHFRTGEGSNLFSRLIHGEFYTEAFKPWSASAGSSGPAKGDVYLDSRKVGSVIWNDANKQMNQPSSDGSTYDPVRGYPLLDYHN